MRVLAFLLILLGLNGVVRAADSPAGLSGVRELVDAAIAAGECPGAVVVIGRSDELLHAEAYGNRQVEPSLEPMLLSTVFDVASLTKPVATGTSVMILVQEQKVDVEAPVSRWLPEFTGEGKEQITVHQLLTHTSGLIADNALKDYLQGPDQAWKKICALKLVAAPGQKFIYSDVGFIVLGKLVERVSGQSLKDFAAERIYRPLGMSETGYLPSAELQARCAPMNQEEGKWIQGVVHDPRARAMGGIAGHAGLFSTGMDLSRFARMILKKGELDGVRILQPATVELTSVGHQVAEGQTRTWGWDHKTGYSSNRGQGMSSLAIGHGGFTGTGLWIDPELDLYVIFLSNRLHPDGKGRVNSLIGQIGSIAVQAVKENSPRP